MAFMLWNLPGLVILTVCGVLLATFIEDPNNPPFWLVGLGPAAISLVFKAFYGFAVKLDSLGVCLALFSCLAAILLDNDARIAPSNSQWVFPTCLIIGAIITFIDSKRKNPWSEYGSPGKGWDRESDETMKRIGIPMWVGGLIIVLWAAVMGVSVALTRRGTVDSVYMEIFSIMYRIGSIIFGGGQVVLPMLQEEVVPAWMTDEQFLQGLGLAQSMPGPLFNFSAYLGAVYKGVPGALIAWLGLFGPGVILIFGIMPFWARLRHNQNFKAILKGLNSTAIGLVGAACVTLWESAIRTSADAMVFSFAITLAVYFNVMAPLVVLAGGIFGALLHEDVLNLGQQPYCVAAGYEPV
jgi:chromate transporter